MKMLNRHEQREKIVFALYQHLLLHKELSETFENNFEEGLDDFSTRILLDIKEHKERYIELISLYLVKWTFDRLNLVEQAILLETISEFKCGLNDKAVVIDEAIIFTKTYCDEESFKYVNSVLDKVCVK